MSAARNEAILSKVLTRLYPRQFSGDKNTNRQPKNETWLKGTVEKQSKVVEASTSSAGSTIYIENNGQNEGNRSVDTEMNLEDGMVQVHNGKEYVHQKIYTVSLPPDNYVPDNHNYVKSSSTEDSELDEDDHSKKRRKRKRRRKKANVKTSTCPDNKHSLQQTEHHTLKHESVPINKSKRKNLQRRRQKERLKAAGLWPKTKTIDLTNRPNKGMVGNDTETQSSEQTQKDKKIAEDLLEFLQATQDMYLTESKSTSVDSVPSIELVLEIIKQIKNGVLPFSEICLLHQVKSLLFLQDIERLKESFLSFKERSSLPLDHIVALHNLFNYWITNILPIKEKLTSWTLNSAFS